MTHPVTDWLNRGMAKEAALQPLSGLSDEQVELVYDMVEKVAGLPKGREALRRARATLQTFRDDPYLARELRKQHPSLAAHDFSGGVLGAYLASKPMMAAVGASSVLNPAVFPVGFAGAMLGGWRGRRSGVEVALKRISAKRMKDLEKAEGRPLLTRLTDGGERRELLRSKAAHEALVGDPKLHSKAMNRMAFYGQWNDPSGHSGLDSLIRKIDKKLQKGTP